MRRTAFARSAAGAHDNLLKALGGVDLPALGFGMGDVVLSELLRERGLVPSFEERLDVFLAAVTEEDAAHLLPLAHRLRDAKLWVEFPVGHASLGKQLKLADARKARFAIVVGPDDRARGEDAEGSFIEPRNRFPSTRLGRRSKHG
jgi:histidyl-tRNA synthetase